MKCASLRRARAFGLLTASVLVACGSDPVSGDNNDGSSYRPSPRPPTVKVTHPASSPLVAAIIGDFAFVSSRLGIGATAAGLRAISTAPATLGEAPENFVPWSLTSTGSGASASAIALLPNGAIPGGPWATFVPTGRPQVGGLVVRAGGGAVSEAVLEAPLASTFPSALVAPASGYAADSLWVADSVFGPGSVVRAYAYTSWSASGTLTEAVGRRFTPTAEDFDGDGRVDQTTLGRLSFADGGRVGLVSFSVLAPGAPGVAGGVYVFDATSGDQLGRIVMPVSSTVAGALEFVGSVRATSHEVVVISAQKSATYADLGGVVAVYRIGSWVPFQVEDADTGAAYDQPFSLVHTSRPNPLGLEVVGDLGALVLDAPFSGPGALDVIDLRPSPATLRQSVELGPLFTNGLVLPGDPRIAPDGTQAFITSEAGLLRVELD